MEQPSKIKEKHTHDTRGLDPILELENAVHVKLLVKDEDSETSDPPDENNSSSRSDENASNHGLYMNDSTSTVLTSSEIVTEGCDGSSQSASASVPMPRKLISAMKGSREKEGLPLKKLSVSWAPDVYDPPPTSVSHYPKKKSQHVYSKSYKRHGKGKQKSKNVRSGGSSPKEKKYYRKTNVKYDRSLESYSNGDGFDNYKSSMELLDYNDPGIGSPDANCGSKFLGQASGATHCVY